MQREGADPVTGGSGGLADGIVTRVTVREMNPIHLPSKISQCLETAFGLRFHMALKGEKKKKNLQIRIFSFLY